MRATIGRYLCFRAVPVFAPHVGRVVNNKGSSMKTYSRLTLAFLLLILVVSLVGGDEPPEVQRDDRFAVGSAISNPKTLQLDYPKLIEVTAGEGELSTYKKHRGDIEGYVEARKSDRGKVFEAMVAHQANQQYIRNPPARVLVVAAELNDSESEDHSADLLLWDGKKVIKRYQLKSYKNAKDIIAVVTQPKLVKYYENEIIVTHPEKLAEVRQQLAKQKKPLTARWEKVEKALKDGRLTDEVKSGLKVPGREEAQKVTDDFLRKMFKRFQAKDGD